MSTIPLFPTWIVHGRQLRRVLLSNTFQHALQLQHRHPFEIVALPTDTHWKKIDCNTMWFPLICARASFFHPLRAFDIVQHTPCSRLLVGNILIEFNAELAVASYEEVEVSRA